MIESPRRARRRVELEPGQADPSCKSRGCRRRSSPCRPPLAWVRVHVSRSARLQMDGFKTKMSCVHPAVEGVFHANTSPGWIRSCSGRGASPSRRDRAEVERHSDARDRRPSRRRRPEKSSVPYDGRVRSAADGSPVVRHRGARVSPDLSVIGRRCPVASTLASARACRSRARARHQAGGRRRGVYSRSQRPSSRLAVEALVPHRRALPRPEWIARLSF